MEAGGKWKVWTPTKLNSAHHEMIRWAFLGLTQEEIAEKVGMSKLAVQMVLASPLAQAELKRMQSEAQKVVVEAPLRIVLQERLATAAKDAVAVNHTLMLDEGVPARTRAGIARHFMDRMVFEKDEEGEREDSYRNILRQLGDIKKTLGESSMLLPPVNGDVVEDVKHDNGNGDS